jgi:hypothetical protein
MTTWIRDDNTIHALLRSGEDLTTGILLGLPPMLAHREFQRHVPPRRDSKIPAIGVIKLDQRSEGSMVEETYKSVLETQHWKGTGAALLQALLD